jgi:hypothetical protein
MRVDPINNPHSRELMTIFRMNEDSSYKNHFKMLLITTIEIHLNLVLFVYYNLLQRLH